MRNDQSRAAIQHFEITLKMLNESMGMCLPTTFTIQRKSPDLRTDLMDQTYDNWEAAKTG